jgi:tryptophan halogenase
LPCDRAVAIQSAAAEKLLPYTRATARPSGWQWRIPLQHRLGNGYVYSSSHLDDDDAARLVLDLLDGAALTEPRFIRFTTGRRRKAWNRNVVALGLASGFMEPLESTSIHFVQAGISKLFALFPDCSFNPVLEAEYNRLTNIQLEQVRDFLILHYTATKRTDSDFWNDCRAIEIPESLARKIALFRSHGRILRFEDELFSETSWIAVLLGQGIVPETYDPLVDTIDSDQVRYMLSRMAEVMRKAADAMPSHGEFIARTCPAPPSGPARIAATA